MISVGSPVFPNDNVPILPKTEQLLLIKEEWSENIVLFLCVWCVNPIKWEFINVNNVTSFFYW